MLVLQERIEVSDDARSGPEMLGFGPWRWAICGAVSGGSQAGCRSEVVDHGRGPGGAEALPPRHRRRINSCFPATTTDAVKLSSNHVEQPVGYPKQE